MLSLLPTLALLQADDNAGSAAASAAGCLGGGVFMIIWLAVFVLFVIGMWKVFEKAGQPGWAAIIPFYNLYILTQIAGRDILWFILMLIPFVNIVAIVLVSLDIARKFGKSAGFGIGLAFLGFIFYPILGFSDAQYNPNA